MDFTSVLGQFQQHRHFDFLRETLISGRAQRLALRGLQGSAPAFWVAALFHDRNASGQAPTFCVVMPDREEAAYFLNSLENLLGFRKDQEDRSAANSPLLFFPRSARVPYHLEGTDNANVLARAEVLNVLAQRPAGKVVVTYPEAMAEKVITQQQLRKQTLHLKRGEKVSLEFITDLLYEFQFERVDFVAEPGQYAVRGGIVDIFSFAHEEPFRIEFMGEEVESIRSFEVASQLSQHKFHEVAILPNVQSQAIVQSYEAITDFLPAHTVYFFSSTRDTQERLSRSMEEVHKRYAQLDSPIKHLEPHILFWSEQDFEALLEQKLVFEFGNQGYLPVHETLGFETRPQPSFNKNFELLLQNLRENKSNRINTILLTDTQRQFQRLETILHDLIGEKGFHDLVSASYLLSVREGFVDVDLGLAFYTDHQIFDRYLRYKLQGKVQKNREALTLKELHGLNPGDFVSHIDHGIGRFAGLEKLDVNGKIQEAIRLIYKDNDILYVSIHSLHKISKYSGSESHVPKLNKLGSTAWSTLKQKTKKRVKELAYDLIRLYAQRKAKRGHAFAPDGYLQTELEASFLYEDTPDQEKATLAVKKDMEAHYPMDRLICGDVGFGKTEVAIRAAFKAVCDGKQAAVLVPTTILALQHQKTFSERLKDFPCTVDFINRFRTAKEIREVLERVAQGKVDILIGTHRILSKDVVFKDLGLLVIDEEQKFGVGSKDKLKAIKVNVDTLTLTATPIPRTLQFSMMGARDLSVIATPPPNRFPVQTEVHGFNEDIIRDAIAYELDRGGQAFFIHNRVQNIQEVAGMISRLVPDARVAIGHGQMDGPDLEKVMVGFISGAYDVLVATTIIESGLDISNANTIIINQAQNFGLSDLHQMRGRVGRSNKKAFCYLLAPPLSTLTQEARKRLRTLEEFAELGSGFNIALRDLDIRGAGNLLGGEQSGFITEIGFEMYMKVLEEAISELKEEDDDFRHNAEDALSVDTKFRSLPKHQFVQDCQIDTDLEILIPDAYVGQTAERLNLYQRLDDLTTDQQLEQFAADLIDRFGPLPSTVEELLATVRLRREAQRIGWEKVVLKGGKMLSYYVSRADSPYFESPVFQAVLACVKQRPQLGRMKESNGKLVHIFERVNDTRSALHIAEVFTSFLSAQLPEEGTA